MTSFFDQYVAMTILDEESLSSYRRSITFDAVAMERGTKKWVINTKRRCITLMMKRTGF